MRRNDSFHVVSVGDLVADVIVNIPTLPLLPDENQIVERTSLEPGGAGNFLIAGAHLGMDMQALGVVGNDTYGNEILKILSDTGIEVKKTIQQVDGSTTVVFVLVDRQGQHVFLGEYGKGPDICLDSEWKLVLEKANAVQAWGYTLQENRLAQTMLESMIWAHAYQVPVFFDPGPFTYHVSKEIRETAIRNSTAILLTEEEIPHLTSGAKGLNAALSLLELGPKIICVKRGSRGCVILTHEQQFEHPGFPVKVMDTTAAGDSFAAGFIYAWLKQWTLKQVAAFANAVGAAKVQKIGSGRQVPTAAEVRQILRINKEELPFLNENED